MFKANVISNVNKGVYQTVSKGSECYNGKDIEITELVEEGTKTFQQLWKFVRFDFIWIFNGILIEP